MSGLRLAVIGAGAMGRLHARAIARRADRKADCALLWIVDRNRSRSEGVAAEFGGRAVDSLDACWGEIDGAVVAVPTSAHVEVTRSLLERDVDVLVEKPMAVTAKAAEELVRLAAERARILAVGHVEWHNTALREALSRAGRPERIEVERLSPPLGRGLDIDVVQDFMLHDLDWVIRSVGEQVIEVAGVGRSVINEGLDEAEANLRFASGCRVRLRASRVHSQRRRHVRIDGENASVELDLLEANGEGAAPDAVEPLDRGWEEFVSACRSRRAPENDGAVGVAAIEMVERVRAAIGRDAGGSGRDDDLALRG